MSNYYGNVPISPRAVIIVSMCNPDSQLRANNMNPVVANAAGYTMFKLFRDGEPRWRAGAKVIGGGIFSRGDFLEVTERIGLCEGDEPDMAEALERVVTLKRREFFNRQTILCGRLVAECVLPLTKWGGCPAKTGNFLYIPNPNPSNSFWDNRMSYHNCAKACGQTLQIALADAARARGWEVRIDGN